MMDKTLYLALSLIAVTFSEVEGLKCYVCGSEPEGACDTPNLASTQIKGCIASGPRMERYCSKITVTRGKNILSIKRACGIAGANSCDDNFGEISCTTSCDSDACNGSGALVLDVRRITTVMIALIATLVLLY